MGRDAFVVSKDVKIYGTLETKRDVRVDGWIDGALVCRRVTISTSATVVGDVVADDVVVEGVVDGNIFADSLTLKASSHVYGDIHHNDLKLDAGCYFEGKSRHSVRPKNLAPVQMSESDGGT